MYFKFKVLTWLFPLLVYNPLSVRCRFQGVLKITTILDPPYLSLKPSMNDSSNGNDLFEGYCKDLADLISAKLGFKYEMHLVKDSSYGRSIGNSDWTGMIGEIINHEADLAISSMAINSRRANAVDFSLPFIQLRLGILLKSRQHSGNSNQSSFLFLKPFTFSLWLTFIATFSVILGILYAIERIVPKNSNSADPENNECERKVRLCSPRTRAGRTLMAVTVVYTGVFGAAYIANFPLIRESTQIQLINGIADLATQKEIKYGVVHEGSTAAFLMNSRDKIHNEVFRNIEREETFVSSSQEGIRRVLNGSYAFIMEELSAKYAAAQNCELSMAPSRFGPLKSFGIAVRRDLKLLKPINLAILELADSGDLEALERKWWNNEVKCPDAIPQSKTSNVSTRVSQLTVPHMAGILYLLMAFLLAGIVIAFVEIRFSDRNIFQMLLCSKAGNEEVRPSSSRGDELEDIPLSELLA